MSDGEPTLAVVGRLGRAQLDQILRRAARRVGRNRPEALALSVPGYDPQQEVITAWKP